jgi:xanthine dehydrogenase accessory factor
VSVFEELRAIVESGERAVVFTVVGGEGLGAKLLVREDGSASGDASAELASLAPDALRRGHSHVVEHRGQTLFADVFGPPPRLLVYGAVDTSEALCRAAKLLGWRTIVADARARFATHERVPSADELIVAWPEEAIEQAQPDFATAVLVLTHDDKFDIPMLKAALASDAFYVGALGSRRNQERRRGLLLEAGVPAHDIERINGPAGLDIGAETPAETALSMLAEVLAVRAGRTGGPLRLSTNRIHAEPVLPAVTAKK